MRSSVVPQHIRRLAAFWRDDERAGVLIFDEPVVVHCYLVPEAIEDEDNLRKLAAFCRKMGRETNQGEIGLVIGMSTSRSATTRSLSHEAEAQTEHGEDRKDARS